MSPVRGRLDGRSGTRVMLSSGQFRPKSEMQESSVAGR